MTDLVRRWAVLAGRHDAERAFHDRRAAGHDGGASRFYQAGVLDDANKAYYEKA